MPARRAPPVGGERGSAKPALLSPVKSIAMKDGRSLPTEGSGRPQLRGGEHGSAKPALLSPVKSIVMEDGCSLPPEGSGSTQLGGGERGSAKPALHSPFKSTVMKDERSVPPEGSGRPQLGCGNPPQLSPTKLEVIKRGRSLDAEGSGGSGNVPSGDGGGSRLDRGRIASVGLPGQGTPTRMGLALEEEGSAGDGSTAPRPSAREQAGACRAVSNAHQDAGNPFSGLLVVFIDYSGDTGFSDELFSDYKENLESLGCKVGSGINYDEATHIVVKGQVPPGARLFWEGDGKVVTTTRWIEMCLEEGKLLPDPGEDSSENLLPSGDLTPLGGIKSGVRKCLTDSKKPSKIFSPTYERSGMNDEDLSSRSRPRRRMLKFAPGGLQKVPTLPSGLYHSLLACEYDKSWSESLYDYALRFKLYFDTSLPGCKGVSRLSKVSTKAILLGSYTLLAGLHLKRKSLGGKFSSKFFIIYSNNSIKLLFDEDSFVIYTDDDGDRDCTRFVRMIVEEVFHNQQPPMDIVEWLMCISQGVEVCCPSVLSNHINLMEPFQGYGMFVVMYQLFCSIEGTSGWKDLYSALSHFDGWHKPIICNLLSKTYYYVDKNGQHTEYELDVRALLRLVWNCSKHQAKRHLKCFVNMVISEYPELLCNLQLALYEGGYLSHLNVKGHHLG